MNAKTEKDSLVKHWRKTHLVNDERVISAFLKVPRESFVLPEFRSDAYHDHPLPTLKNQTISQPTTVMMMTDHAKVSEGMKVLEVGAGSGYQAAILSTLVGPKGKVITVDIDKDLTIFAHKNLKNYKNVTVILAKEDSIGYSNRAPYDRIIVTAALPRLPNELLSQLKDGGVMVLPVGTEYLQEILVVEKIRNTLVNIVRLGSFQFVPVKGKFGF